MDPLKPSESDFENDPYFRIFSSADLFQGQKEIIIRHEDQRYRLLITKAGKLILNK